jgi:hypothetical protein
VKFVSPFPALKLPLSHISPLSRLKTAHLRSLFPSVQNHFPFLAYSALFVNSVVGTHIPHSALRIWNVPPRHSDPILEVISKIGADGAARDFGWPRA